MPARRRQPALNRCLREVSDLEIGRTVPGLTSMYAFRDPALPPDARAAGRVERLTLCEKDPV
jgi:hypothetical protein